MTKKFVKGQREANFYLATAKLNKGVSMALYYMGLVGTPVAGIVKACQADKFADGVECVLAGGIMGVVMIGVAAALRQQNMPLLRDYVALRDQAMNQKVK